MKCSKRYSEIKKEIDNKIFSLQEGLKFILNSKKEKSSRLKISFSLELKNQKILLKKKILLPFPSIVKNHIVVIKNNLPDEICQQIKNNQVDLLTNSEIESRMININKNKIKKKSQWGFTKILAYPDSEKIIKPLESKLAITGIFPNKKNNTLTFNIIDELTKFFQGEQEIKNDKAGNINTIIGTSEMNLEELEKNYNYLYNNVLSLKPVNWKGNFLKKVVISTAMGPGIKIFSL